MMFPPIYELAIAAAPVKALLGQQPRLYLFGEAPPNVQVPYAVWQQGGGAPENYLGQRPDMDGYSVQLDVYGRTAAESRSVAQAIRDAVEGDAYVTSWNGESRDSETRNYRYSFTVEFLESR